jgi:hypothetical protein
VFPNPTSGKFTVASDREGFTDVVVSDVFGNVMLSSRFMGELEIDTNSWAAGIYLVNYGVPGSLGRVAKLVKL